MLFEFNILKFIFKIQFIKWIGHIDIVLLIWLDYLYYKFILNKYNKILTLKMICIILIIIIVRTILKMACIILNDLLLKFSKKYYIKNKI